ncbi:hypothetical protein EYF80_048589 [Liparis tanakae]|uniref:Uncharacterized protein n=1 Tax=Liparis tanakae TaxID=230148 RepID=A0A4Z2FKF2_9TELE|nr:hypothetical protein EYF80_048589 [Liparis tanakae]
MRAAMAAGYPTVLAMAEKPLGSPYTARLMCLVSSSPVFGQSGQDAVGLNRRLVAQHPEPERRKEIEIMLFPPHNGVTFTRPIQKA